MVVLYQMLSMALLHQLLKVLPTKLLLMLSIYHQMMKHQVFLTRKSCKPKHRGVGILSLGMWLGHTVEQEKFPYKYSSHTLHTSKYVGVHTNANTCTHMHIC